MPIDLSNEKARRQYHSLVLQIMARMERTVFNQLKPMINRQYMDAASLITQGVRDVDHVVNEQTTRLRKILRAHYRRVAMTAGRQATIAYDPPKSMNESFWNEVNQFIALNAGRKVKLMQDTSKGILDFVIQTGIENGETNREIATRLRKQGKKVSKFQALRIARTETLGIYNAATDASVRDTGLKFDRVWSTTKDLRTRRRKKKSFYDHWIVDGQRRKQGEPFDVSGQNLDYPGDPKGSAGNIINCLHPSSVVNFTTPDKLIRRWYNGKMIVIETTGGHKLTVTPNHPILGSEGWVSAHLLKKGNSVIGCNLSDINIFSGFNFNIKNINASIEQVFNLFSSTLHKVRSGSAIVDFHGEITNEDVDIVRMDAGLRNGGVFSFFDPFKKLRLTGPDKLLIGSPSNRGFFKSLIVFNRGCITNCNKFFSSFFSLIDSLFVGHLGPFKLFRLALSPGIDVINNENPVNSSSLQSGRLRDFINGHAVIKKVNDFFESRRVLSNKSKFQAIGMGTPNITENGVEFPLRDVKSFLKFKWGNAFKVQPFDITKITHFDYSGYVYNLEDNKSYYICNGVVNHNCRCVLMYERNRDL